MAKSPAMFSTACWRNWMIWLGCSSHCSANSATVLSPFKAARATLTRNSGEKVLRGRLVEMLLGAQRLNDPRPTINYRPVSKKRSGSDLVGVALYLTTVLRAVTSKRPSSCSHTCVMALYHRDGSSLFRIKMFISFLHSSTSSRCCT